MIHKTLPKGQPQPVDPRTFFARPASCQPCRCARRCHLLLKACSRSVLANKKTPSMSSSTPTIQRLFTQPFLTPIFHPSSPLMTPRARVSLSKLGNATLCLCELRRGSPKTSASSALLLSVKAYTPLGATYDDMAILKIYSCAPLIE